jgi:hypothetical protein
LLSTICVRESKSLEFDDNMYYLHSLFILQCLNIRYLCFHGPSHENVEDNGSAMTRFTLSGTERLGQTVYEGLGTEN